jgi:hypothetical protein
MAAASWRMFPLRSSVVKAYPCITFPSIGPTGKNHARLIKWETCQKCWDNPVSRNLEHHIQSCIWHKGQQLLVLYMMGCSFTRTEVYACLI